MEKRRALVSTIFIFAFALWWMNFAPKIFPQFFQQGQNAGQQQAAQDPGGDEPEGAPDADEPDAAVDNAEPDVLAENAEPEPEPDELVEHPHRLIGLGSLDPTSGYFMKVTINTAGAVVELAELNDPRYCSVDDRGRPLKIVGDRSGAKEKTLQTSLKAIDDQLKAFDTSLSEVDWKVVKEAADGVLLSYTAPDGMLEVRKHFRLNQGNIANPDEDETGYLLDFDLTIVNRSDRPRDVSYSLLGPVGVPLEDRNNSRTYVEIKAGTLDDGDPDDVTNISLTAASLVKQTDKAARMNDPGRLETWGAPIKYVGTDVAYFAALLIPTEDQLQQRYFKEAKPVIVTRDGKNGLWSDVSVRLESESLSLLAKPANGEAAVTHSFQLFLGPKRSELLEPLGADGVQALGWFGVIALGMLSILHFFHGVLLLPYGVAIMLLTVVVRGCLFPISRKIAHNQKRMKELQPKMEEIRTKYADNKEKQAEAYREFMAKNGFNPLAGCLPMFLQLPIFLGLYRALYASVDLRMAEFLWIDNLAAPDELFLLPFTVPLLGWTHFNLLPLLTVALFTAQQKLFMPPPTSDEQAMQYKMMNYFTLFIGFMFYKVAAGLCVYFIVSSLWGICERKLLEKFGDTSDPKQATSDAEQSGGRKGDGGSGGTKVIDEPKPKPPGFFARLMEAADEARNQTNGSTTKRDRDRDKSKKRRKSKHRR